MAEFLEKIVPFLEDASSTTRRRGAAEACYHAVERMALAVIPYIVILVIPIMGRMSDFDTQVRAWLRLGLELGLGSGLGLGLGL